MDMGQNKHNYVNTEMNLNWQLPLRKNTFEMLFEFYQSVIWVEVKKAG